MGTRSRIGILKRDGSVTSIYCMKDGYIDGVGLRLYKYYNNLNSINKLISLGDIDSLHTYPDLETAKLQEFGNGDITKFFYRDEKEKWKDCKPIDDKNLDDFFDTLISTTGEYAYLYDELQQKWMMYKDSFGSSEIELIPLEEELNRELDMVKEMKI
ncbi:MAG: hypothetical protein IJ068_00355 [Bacilli bacterium]|nr:hypothetical protein [Bacilli bacterium]